MSNPELIALAQRVWNWWKEHQYDTVGEDTLYDHPPLFVYDAARILGKKYL